MAKTRKYRRTRGGGYKHKPEDITEDDTNKPTVDIHDTETLDWLDTMNNTADNAIYNYEAMLIFFERNGNLSDTEFENQKKIFTDINRIVDTLQFISGDKKRKINDLREQIDTIFKTRIKGGRRRTKRRRHKKLKT